MTTHDQMAADAKAAREHIEKWRLPPEMKEFEPAAIGIIDGLAAHIDTLLAKLDFLKSKGLTVTTAKDADGPPRLVYMIERDSELCDLRAVNKQIEAEVRVADLEAQHAADQQRIADAVILLSERGEMQARIAELEAELRLFSDDQKRYTAEAAFDRMKRTELEAEVARLRDACEQAETAITDGVLGGDEEYSRLAQPYAQATLDVLRKAMKP